LSFLSSWWLLLSLSAAVPIILHRRKRTGARIAFPALRYLTTARDARARSFATSDLLLLVVRICLLAVLALAAAGLLLGRGEASDHPPTDLALIVDNSASTGRLVDGRPLHEDLLDRARVSLAAAGPADRVWLFPTVGAPLAAGAGPRRAAALLEGIGLTDGSSNLSDVVARAGAALPLEQERVREIQLLSDLQASGFGAASGAGSDPRADIPVSVPDDTPVVVYHPAPPDGSSGALARAEPSAGGTAPVGIVQGIVVRPVLASADPENEGDNFGTEEATARMEVDGELAGAARLPWNTETVLPLPPLPAGMYSGRVLIDPSGARNDDVRHFAVTMVSPPRVAVVGDDGAEFLSLGVETLRGAGRLGGEADPGVVVVVGAAEASLRLARSAATTVFIPPSRATDLPPFNQMLAAAGARYRVEPDTAVGTLGLSESAQAVAGLPGTMVHSRYLFRGTVPGRDSVLLSTADGTPWLLRTVAADRVILLFASPLTPEATDLPTRPGMIPFLETVFLRWSHLSTWPPSGFDAGAEVVLPGWAREVEGPEGNVSPAVAGWPFVPASAGVYRVRGAGREAAFAANVPEPEMYPALIARDAIPAALGTSAITVAGPGEADFKDAIYRVRRAHNVDIWLVCLAGALAILEMILAAPRGGRRPTAAGGSP